MSQKRKGLSLMKIFMKKKRNEGGKRTLLFAYCIE